VRRNRSVAVRLRWFSQPQQQVSDSSRTTAALFGDRSVRRVSGQLSLPNRLSILSPVSLGRRRFLSGRCLARVVLWNTLAIQLSGLYVFLNPPSGDKLAFTMRQRGSYAMSQAPLWHPPARLPRIPIVRFWAFILPLPSASLVIAVLLYMHLFLGEGGEDAFSWPIIRDRG
jgi:hypothetical protein